MTRFGPIHLALVSALCSATLACGTAESSASDLDDIGSSDVVVAEDGAHLDTASDAARDTARDATALDAGTDAGSDDADATDVTGDSHDDDAHGVDGSVPDVGEPECLPPNAECNGECVDVRTSLEHCGFCGAVCAAGVNDVAACVGGVCQSDCATGFVDLDGELGCEYECTPSNSGEEICDGVDNDCDGETDLDDDSYVATPCLRGEGVCAGIVRECDAGVARVCTDEDYSEYALDVSGASYQRGEETLCDGFDNDCAGGVDESCCDGQVVDFTRMPADVTPGRGYRRAESRWVGAAWLTYAVSDVDAPVSGSQAVLLSADGDPLSAALLVTPLGSVVGEQESFGLTLSDTLLVWSANADGVVVESVSLASESRGESLEAPRLIIDAPGASQVAVTQDGVSSYVAYVTPSPDNAERSRFHIRSVFSSGEPTLDDDEQVGQLGQVDNLRLWATPNGVVVCHLERISTKVKCLPFGITLSPGTEVEGTFVRPDQNLSPFLPWPDGGASVYVVSPRGICTESSCPFPVFELRVGPDGGVSETQLSLQTQQGAFRALGGQTAHWFVISEPAEPPDGTFTQALYRRDGDEFERVAILPETTPDDAFSLIDDGEITRLLTRRGPENAAVYTLVGISPDGAPLCPLP